MVNKVILVGNLGADPEIRTFEDGNKVARIRIATTERIYNPTTQERKDHTEWHSVTLRRGLATVAEQYLRKGSQVYIEGKIRSREWEDENKNRRFSIEIMADDLKMLGRRSDAPGGGMGPAAGGQGSYGNAPSQFQARPQGGGAVPSANAPYNAGGNAYGAPQAQPAAPNAPSAEPFDNLPSDVDDLPF